MINIGKIDNNLQWITLLAYRFLIYVPLPWFIAICRFDKRIKYINKVVLWYNKMFLGYLLVYGTIKVLALDMRFGISAFNALDSYILILGYIFTIVTKKQISFDETGNIISGYLKKENKQNEKQTINPRRSK